MAGVYLHGCGQREGAETITLRVNLLSDTLDTVKAKIYGEDAGATPETFLDGDKKVQVFISDTKKTISLF